MNYITIIQFAWRVLFLSLIASPVFAQEGSQGFPAPALPAFSQPQPSPSAPQIEDSSISQELDNYSPPACLECNSPSVCEAKFWIVSSRCAVQNIHERCLESWGLDVYEGSSQGHLGRTTLESMSAQLNPAVPICIFSHGSFVRWESQCQEAFGAYQKLQRCTRGPIQFIFFTWPSDGPFTFILPVDVGVRGKQAEFNGFHMAHLLSRLPQQSHVSLIGHSHGARVILSAMHLAGGGTVQGHVFNGSLGQRRYRTVLAAAASDHNWLNPGQRYGCALNATECLLNLRNRRDAALAFYPLVRPLFTPSLGRRSFTRRDAAKLGYHARKIRTVDVTCDLDCQHLWPYYYNDPEVVAAILPYICY